MHSDAQSYSFDTGYWPTALAEPAVVIPSLEKSNPNPVTQGSSKYAQTIEKRMSDFFRRSAALDSAPVQLKAQKPAPSGLASENQMHNILALTASIKEIPVEGGIIHPGEALAQKIIDAVNDSASLVQTLFSSCSMALLADVLLLFGRLDISDKTLRVGLVQKALQSDSLVLRDAAAQAVELWEDQNAAEILARHQETVPWLAEYMQEIVEDLQAN